MNSPPGTEQSSDVDTPPPPVIDAPPAAAGKTLSEEAQLALEAKEEAARRNRLLGLMQSIDAQPDFASLKAKMIDLQRISRSEVAHTRALTLLIQDDPAMLGKLLRLINAAYYSTSGGGNITSMHLAVSLMGFRNIGMVAGALMLFEQLPKNSDGNRLRREFARAQLAASLAQDFCASRKHIDHIYLATLFQRLGDLLAGLHFAEDAQVLEDLLDAQELLPGSAKRAKVRDKLARERWGKTVEEIGLDVAAQWGWPQHVLLTMQSLVSDDPEVELQGDEYARVLNTAGNVLAEDLMRLPAQGTAEEQAEARKAVVLRWAQDLAVPLKLDLETIADQVDATVADWRELLAGLGVSPDAFNGEAAEHVAPKKNKLDPQSRAYREALAENLADAVDVITRMNKRGAPLDEILDASLRQIIKALDLQRALVCMLDAESGQLTGRLGVGHKAVVLAPLFRVPLAPPTDLFGMLTSKSADVLITDTADPLIEKRLPDWFKVKVKAGSFVLLTLSAQGRVMGMIYGDQQDANSMQVSPRALILLKQLRDQVLLAMSKTPAAA